MATLLERLPAWQQFLDNPDFWQTMTPEQRKLKYWPAYKRLIQDFPQFGAVPEADFLNDPYAAFEKLDRYIQTPTEDLSASQTLAQVDLAFPTGGNTQQIVDWVKRVTDAGKNPYDLLTGLTYPAEVKVGIYDAVEAMLGKLGVTQYTMPKIDLGGGVMTDPATTPVSGPTTPPEPPLAGDKQVGEWIYTDSNTRQNRNTGEWWKYDPEVKNWVLQGGGTNQPPVKPPVENAPLTNRQVPITGDPAAGAKQSLSDASWWYGGGPDFAAYGNFPYAPETEGGRTWKPGTILGQEAQRRYLAGDQFMQYLPEAFRQVVAGIPQRTPTPTWASFSQGLNTPGMWAGGYPQNINVGGRAIQTGQYTQPWQTQAQQFTPYQMTAPYGFPQQQYDVKQQQQPWYSGFTGTPQAGTQQAGTQETGLAGTSPLAAAGTTGTPETSLAGTKTKTTTPTYAPYPLTSTARTYSSWPASMPQTWAGEFANVGGQAFGQQYPGGPTTIEQMRQTASPYSNIYGTSDLRTQAQNYARSPGVVGASGRSLGTERQVAGAVTGQFNQNPTQNQLYRQAQSALSSQLGQNAPMSALNTAITGAINPMEIYNKQLQDTLYTDQTRRLQEDYDKQSKEAQDYYSFYGLSGSSAEKKAMDDMNLALARKKEDIKNTLDAQMIQKAQALEAQRLSNLTGAYSTLGQGQNAAITSALGLMDYPQAQQRAAAGLGLGLLGQQQTGAQNEFSRLMQSLGESTGAQGQEASILSNLSNLGMQGYGAGSDVSQWSANYWDQVAQQERNNALQDYLMSMQESQYGDTQSQQNFQNLQTLLGLGTGMYDTFGGQGWNQMRLTAGDLANLAQGWNQRQAVNQQGNNWWQSLLGPAANVSAAMLT